MSGMITLYSACPDCRSRDIEIARLNAENERLREKARAVVASIYANDVPEGSVKLNGDASDWVRVYIEYAKLFALCSEVEG